MTDFATACEEFWTLAMDARNGKVVGAKSGLPRFDRLTGGFSPGELTYLAGSTGGGKTAFAMQVVGHVALTEDHAARRESRAARRVLVFSREMPRAALVGRMACGRVGVDMAKVRAGKCTPKEYEDLAQAMGWLACLPADVHDDASCTVLDVRAEVLRAQSRGGVALVVVDYLQIMDAVSRADNEARQLAEMSRALKNTVAIGCNVPVLALSQFNRATGTATPELRNLKGSSSLEQDADMALILHGKAPEKDRDGRPVYEPRRDVALIVAKQRFGPFPITLPMVFEGRKMTFTEAGPATAVGLTEEEDTE